MLQAIAIIRRAGPSALSRNGFRVNRRGFALIWKSDNALGGILNLGLAEDTASNAFREIAGRAEIDFSPDNSFQLQR